MAGTMVKTLYDEIFEKGVFNGELKGIRKGIRKGIKKGIKKGRTKEGANMLLRQLSKRFGEVHVDVKEKLYAKQDPVVLESLAEQLLDCKTIEEFIELL